MAEYAAVNAVAAGSIQAINGVAKSSAAAVNGATTPSSGSTQWGIVNDNGGAGYAATSDLTSWTTYMATANESTDYKSITYGKDGSGNPRWVIIWGENSSEVQYSDDITDTSGWTDVDFADNPLPWDSAWGNNVWVAIGTQSGSAGKHLWRSTDGASWAKVDLSGISGFGTEVVKGIATDGAGTWMFGQLDRLYQSTDDGQTWSEAVDFNDSDIAGIRNIEYTNSTWVIMFQDTGAGGGAMVRTAAAGDRTDWSTAQDLSIGASATRFACGDGVCLFIISDDVRKATVSGKTCTLATYTANQLPAGSGKSAQNIATDGTGTFVVVGSGGTVQTTTDNGANWTLSVDGLDQPDDNNVKIRDVAANVYMPV